MRNGTCVKCGTTAVYRLPQSRWADSGYPVTGFRRAGTTVYVCTDCGYTETWTDPGSLPLVREHGRAVAPHSGIDPDDVVVIRPQP